MDYERKGEGGRWVARGCIGCKGNLASLQGSPCDVHAE